MSYVLCPVSCVPIIFLDSGNIAILVVTCVQVSSMSNLFCIVDV